MTSEVRVYGYVRSREVSTVARQLIPHCPSYQGDDGPKRTWIIPRLGKNSSPSLYLGLGGKDSSFSC